MYSSRLNRTDRTGAIVAALLIQAALLIAFLNMAGKIGTSETQAPLPLVNIAPTPPPPPVTEQLPTKPRQKRSGSAPDKVKSEAASSAASAQAPVMRAPAKPIETTAPADGQGLASAAGGAGEGGSGNGVGNGSGDGDGGGAVEPPHLATGVLTGYDFSREIIDEWPRAATVFLRLKIDARGFVSECLVDRGTNIPLIDSAMCNTAHERLRFRPALDRRGRPVAGWFGYAQPAPR